MVDTQLLRKKMNDKNSTISDIAEKIGIDKATLYRRMADTEAFTIGEVEKIAAVLGLSREEAVNIFFNPIVA